MPEALEATASSLDLEQGCCFLPSLLALHSTACWHVRDAWHGRLQIASTCFLDRQPGLVAPLLSPK